MYMVLLSRESDYFKTMLKKIFGLSDVYFVLSGGFIGTVKLV